ncbi:MAG: helix-turn-helix transcriptional regulator [Candidatus Zixiibacteriota bacterium]
MSQTALKIFADQMKRMRNARNWTQNELAERADLSTDAICRMETGKMVPTLTTLDKLAAGFGVELSTLVQGIGCQEAPTSKWLSQLSDLMATRSDKEIETLFKVAVVLFVDSEK